MTEGVAYSSLISPDLSDYPSVWAPWHDNLKLDLEKDEDYNRYYDQLLRATDNNFVTAEVAMSGIRDEGRRLLNARQGTAAAGVMTDDPWFRSLLSPDLSDYPSVWAPWHDNLKLDLENDQDYNSYLEQMLRATGNNFPTADVAMRNLRDEGRRQWNERRASYDPID